MVNKDFKWRTGTPTVEGRYLVQVTSRVSTFISDKVNIYVTCAYWSKRRQWTLDISEVNAFAGGRETVMGWQLMKDIQSPRIPVLYEGRTFLEISARQMYKTTRLVNEAVDYLKMGNAPVIITINQNAARLVENDIIGKHGDTIKRGDIPVMSIGEFNKWMERPREDIGRTRRFFFDEFDFMEMQCPVILGAYYATTPAYLRGCPADPNNPYDPLTELVEIVGEDEVVHKSSVQGCSCIDTEFLGHYK